MLINYEYLWDLLQRPGILFDTGCNIIIFEDNNYSDVKLKCPYKEDIKLFYKSDRPIMLIYTNNIFYEPIYHVTDRKKIKTIKCIFNIHTPIISDIYNTIINNCKHKYDIDWHRILQETEEIYNTKINEFNFKDEISLNKTLKLLDKIKDKKYKIKYQFLDSYNKVVGII